MKVEFVPVHYMKVYKPTSSKGIAPLILKIGARWR